MSEYVARLRTGVPMPRVAREHLYLARTVAVCLIAIGVSGALCGLVRYRYGDHVLAADSQSRTLSAARCADLFEYHPEKSSCPAAEMAHHADEIVEYRIGSGALGLFGIVAYVGVRSWSALTDEERRQQRFRYLLTAVAAFALAAGVLLSVGIAVQLKSTNAAPRWFADGGVALTFCVLHAVWLARSTP